MVDASAEFQDGISLEVLSTLSNLSRVQNFMSMNLRWQGTQNENRLLKFSESEPQDVVNCEFDHLTEPETTDEPLVPQRVWMNMVGDAYNSFCATHSDLLLPWETGAHACIFSDEPMLAVPKCLPLVQTALDDTETGRQLGSIETAPQTLDADCKFASIVRNMPDLDYFEQKSQSLELACGRWLELLSINWTSLNVGVQLKLDLQRDSTGATATETLRACFGVKSPSTLLKRAGTFRQFVKWFNSSEHSESGSVDAFPSTESAVGLLPVDAWAKECCKGLHSTINIS